MVLYLAGIAIPPQMQGRSVMPLAENKKVTWRDDWLYEYYEYPGWQNIKPCRGVRTKRYKYIHFFLPPEEFELYDLQNDPDEQTNLYGNRIRTAHRERTWMANGANDSLTPDGRPGHALTSRTKCVSCSSGAGFTQVLCPGGPRLKIFICRTRAGAHCHCDADGTFPSPNVLPSTYSVAIQPPVQGQRIRLQALSLLPSSAAPVMLP